MRAVAAADGVHEEFLPRSAQDYGGRHKGLAPYGGIPGRSPGTYRTRAFIPHVYAVA